MYLDSIVSISEAENALKQRRADSAAEAKRAVAGAREAGQRQVEEAAARAEEEIRALMQQTEEKARRNAVEKAAGMENRKAVLHARAETRMDKATDFIVERIVNG